MTTNRHVKRYAIDMFKRVLITGTQIVVCD